MAVNLQSLNTQEFLKVLDSFDHIFSDCDGVIWSSQKPYENAGEFFKLMEKLGKTVHFVSNNSIRTEENYRKLFESASLQNGFERLTIPSVAIAEYLKSINFDKQVYCISCVETMKVLEKYGFKCKYGPDTVPDYYGDFVQYLKDDTDIGAVVLDSDFKVNMPKIYKAMTYIKRADVLLINGASDRRVPMLPGCLTLGTAVFTDVIKEESNREQIDLGKPSRMFGEFAMKRAKVTDPSRVLFIGDMIDQDIQLGKNTGFKTLLVLTSCNKEAMLARTDIQPDFYADGLGDLVPQIKSAL